MNPSTFAQHLINELPRLAELHVIDAANAETLRQHYAPQIRPPRSLSIGLTISAILGALLIGSGIILLLAHNWDDLARPVRAIVAMLPLLISITLAGFTLLRRADSTAWREGSGIFYFLSIGAAIALISQTYHLYSDMEKFLLVWMALSLPLIYLLRSGSVFVGFLACLVSYHFVLNEVWRSTPPSHRAWWGIVALLPFFAWHLWKHRESLTTTWISAALAIAVTFMLFAYVGKPDFRPWELPFSMTFALFYVTSCSMFAHQRGWRNPLRAIGCLGIAALSIAFTFRDILSPDDLWENGRFAISLPLAVYWLLTAAAVIAAVGSMYRRHMSFNWIAALFGFIVLMVMFSPNASLLMNAYVTSLGIFTLVQGVKRDSLLSMNEGLILIVALIVGRFFDEDFGFVARGIAFILAGSGFLGMNIWVLSSRRGNDPSRKVPA